MKQVWRSHPKLRGRFHPESPDDVQVLVHDGGPRITDRLPETVWVTITGCEDSGFLIGRILNQPEQLTTVSQGAEIKFTAPAGEHLLMVTDKYLHERRNWVVQPCDRCGLDELFDAPSDLVPAIFSDLPEGASMETFTSFCGVCGGVQIVNDKRAETALHPNATQKKKSWWRFWEQTNAI